MRLVQPLFEGPVDVVGDVHGCLEELLDLLDHCDYTRQGHHPEGRRLVFLGDLTDRGPDSLGVVRLVRELVSSGRAQCILGNHDFNLLLGERKHENGWFFGDARPTDSDREMICEFLTSLPLALERPDLRVVHAFWDDSMIAQARTASDILALYRQAETTIEEALRSQSLDAIDEGLFRQNKNPIKLLTSGPEERITEPFEAGGKLRYERRVRWWESYSDPAFCVFGHYALRRAEHRPGHAVCADFGLSYRDGDRGLAALRFPEKTLAFHDRQC